MQMETHPLRTSVRDLVEGLRALENETITKARIAEFLTASPIQAEALSSYILWRDSAYTRNLIYRDELFEVMVICWGAGQKTPVHTHNGQLGWMAVVQGELLTHHYRYVRCSAPENQNVIGMDCLAGAQGVELERLDTVKCSNDGQILTVDKLQTIHQIENADSCVAFDLERHLCLRRSLRFYSAQGIILPE